jgi:hypothetical protein
MATPKQMRDKAEHYRELASLITDAQTSEGLTRLASGLDESADKMEAQIGRQDRAE